MTGGRQRTRTNPLARAFRANEFSGLPTGRSCRRQAARPPLSDARSRPGTARRCSGSGSATGHAERADRSSRDTAAFAHGVGPAALTLVMRSASSFQPPRTGHPDPPRDRAARSERHGPGPTGRDRGSTGRRHPAPRPGRGRRPQPTSYPGTSWISSADAPRWIARGSLGENPGASFPHGSSSDHKNRQQREDVETGIANSLGLFSTRRTELATRPRMTGDDGVRWRRPPHAVTAPVSASADH